VAGDNYGNLFTYNDPTGGAAKWTLTALESRPLLGASCPSAALCVLTDQEGDVVTSTHPRGGKTAWTITGLEGYSDINGISCPTVSFCAAIDQAPKIITSVDPTGGAFAWAPTAASGVSQNGYSGISCATASLCVPPPTWMAMSSARLTRGAGQGLGR
jgi:hypothetical protein